MDQTVIRYFGFVIAYLIPGMLGLYAASYFSPLLREWFGAAAQQQTTIGGFLFVIVGSVGMGVFLSGVRWILFDKVLGEVLSLSVSLDHGQRSKSEHTERVYQSLIANHYQYYQYYSNTSVALLLLFIAWAVAEQPAPSTFGGRFVILVLAESVLVYSAHGAMRLFKTKSSQLLNSKAA